MNQLRVGLVGCGSIALSAHLPALAELTSMAKLVTVCDVRADVAELTARTHNVSTWTTDHHQIAADPSIDVVIITTPEFLHAEHAIAALNAKKHVLCEKPIAATLDEADRILSTADKVGTHFMVAHSRRFTARYTTIRDQLDAGVIGEPVLIRENERRPRAQYSALNLPVDVWQPDPAQQKPWKDLAEYSGGVARGHAIHELDLFRWFAGAEAKSVYAESKITLEGREVPDAISIQLDFVNGVMGACDLYSQAPSGYPFYHQLEIIGEHGVLRARDTDMITMTRFGSSGMQYPTAYSSLLHINDAYVNEQRLFFDAIRSDSPVPLDPRDARAALELATAATLSANTGQRVDIPLDTIQKGNGLE